MNTAPLEISSLPAPSPYGISRNTPQAGETVSPETYNMRESSPHGFKDFLRMLRRIWLQIFPCCKLHKGDELFRSTCKYAIFDPSGNLKIQDETTTKILGLNISSTFISDLTRMDLLVNDKFISPNTVENPSNFVSYLKREAKLTDRKIEHLSHLMQQGGIYPMISFDPEFRRPNIFEHFSSNPEILRPFHLQDLEDLIPQVQGRLKWSLSTEDEEIQAKCKCRVNFFDRENPESDHLRDLSIKVQATYNLTKNSIELRVYSNPKNTEGTPTCSTWC